MKRTFKARALIRFGARAASDKCQGKRNGGGCFYFFSVLTCPERVRSLTVPSLPLSLRSEADRRRRGHLRQQHRARVLHRYGEFRPSLGARSGHRLTLASPGATAAALRGSWGGKGRWTDTSPRISPGLAEGSHMDYLSACRGLFF